MHKKLPNLFIFLDKYSSDIFNYNNTNIGVIYRNYHETNRELELSKISKACKQKRYKLFVSNNIKLAIKFKAEGIYIPSFNKKKFSNLEKKNFIILGSAHNQKEINEKMMQKCEAIFLSPIFPIIKKKNYLGIRKFNLLKISNNAEFLALGGINKNNFLKLKMTKINGFGSVSLFKKKPAFKRPVFLKNNFFRI